MNRKTSGFTLTEVIVVVAVISILSAVLYANFNDSRELTRDAQRKADLRLVQNALELYKLDHGRYPEGCNAVGNWSGQLDTNFECSDGGTDYIRGVAARPFSPAYLPILPIDPKLNGLDSGYAYITNSSGSVYKFVALKTVESEEYISFGQDYTFKPCDTKTINGSLFATTPITGLPQEGTSGGNPFYGYATCNRYQSEASYIPAPDCSISVGAKARTTYAVWGGFGNPEDAVGAPALINTNEKKVEYATERIICDLP